jgi:hypothetical protein
MSYIIDKFINNEGIYNYAYVVMIINNDIYANPGIIFAESLRKIGCLCDIVALIDNKISKETILLLQNFFNKIIEINSIEINNINEIQKVILSKINVFNLIEYEKIFLIDVDTIIFTNIDTLFLQYNINNNENIIYSIDKNNFGFILIKPSKEIYNKCNKIIKKYNNQIENELKPFDFLIKKIYGKNIKKLDLNISWNKYENTDGIQYRKDKPFLMSSNLTIEDRIRLDHYKVWFSYFINIINKYPEIKKYKCINESTQVSRYFLASLSRFIINFVKLNKTKKLENIINIYGKNNYKNLDYYHLDITKEYTNKYIKYNINTYDNKLFLEYLDLNLNIYINNNFKNFYEYTTTKKLIEELEKYDEKILNIFLNNYIKIFPNIFIVMEIEEIINSKLSTNKKYKPLPDLKNNLVYYKQYNLKNNILKNILFNLYQNYTYYQRYLYLQNSINKNEYTISISIYEMSNEIIEYDQNSNTDVFIFYEQNSKIRLSSIFFNPNTIKYYDNLNFLNIFESNDINLIKKNINLSNLINMIYLQTLKKWIYNIYNGNEINNLGLYYEKYNKILLIDNNKQLISKIKNINLNKIFFIEIIFSNSSQYKNIIVEKNIDIKKIYDITKYWEYEGLKFIN